MPNISLAYCINNSVSTFDINPLRLTNLIYFINRETIFDDSVIEGKFPNKIDIFFEHAFGLQGFSSEVEKNLSANVCVNRE